MTDTDTTLSRTVTDDLNASMPEVVRLAGHGRIASSMLLIAAFSAVAVGFAAAIFGAALAESPALLVLIIAIFVLLIAVEIAALVVGVRAKRAFTRIAQTVEAQHQVTLVRVVGRELHVRARPHDSAG